MAACALSSTAQAGQAIPGRRLACRVPLRVLLIEDAAVTAQVVQAYLQAVSPDSTMRWAGDMAQARALLAGESFDLVITDLNLPDSRGLATLEAVLSTTDRLVVVLTSEEDRDFETAAIERGVYDFLHKSRLSRESLGQVVRLATIQADTLRSLSRTTAERDVQRQQVEFLSHHDRLTGLAHRGQFLARLGSALDAARKAGFEVAVGVLDVERFRSLNVALGQPGGDGLLREVAGRLARAAGVPAVGRVGIDQFAILLEPVRGVSEAERAARSVLREACAEPYAGDGGSLEFSARMGLSRFPADAADAPQALRGRRTHCARRRPRGKP